MKDPIEMIRAAAVLPVVTIDDAGHAAPLAVALTAGGLGVVEVTLRTDAGIAAISAIVDASPATCVGAGSVTTAGQARAAADAGAHFLVSPGFDEAVVSVARERGIPVIPGIATATELMSVLARGLNVVKLFPAEQIGGVAAIQAFASVWPDVLFVPTGGVSADNAVSYLANRRVLAVGGSWIARRELIASQDWTQITTHAAAAVAMASEIRSR